MPSPDSAARSASDLLTDADGIGETRARALLDHFGSGREVAKAAASNFAAIASVEGFSPDSAKTLHDRMREAGVYEPLRDRGHVDA